MRMLRVPTGRFYFWLCILTPLLLGADRPEAPKPMVPDLKIIRTHHYEIHTDMESSLVDDLSTRMDSMF